MNVLLAMLAGAAHALSLAWPFEWGLERGQAVPVLQVAALALLVWQLQHRATPRAAALTGWCFGLAMLSGTFWWLFISMHTYGGLAAPLAVLAVLALAGALALLYAAACAAYVAWRPALPWPRAVVFVAAWTMADLLRGWLFTGFPWGVGGYAHVDGWLANYATWVGVYGVGAVATAVAAMLALLAFGGWPSRAALGASVLVLLALPWWNRPDLTGADICTTVPPLSVALLQGNIAQDQKFEPGTGVADALDWYGQHLRLYPASLVVAPETAIPVLPDELPDTFLNSLTGYFGQADGAHAALVGVPLGDAAQGYTNSVWGLKPGQAQNYRYDKQHLVPFGEFIPTGFKWFTRMMHIPLGDFNRGALAQDAFEWQGQRLAPNICYEDLFGEELAARFSDPLRAPTVFVNVSNLGWFGDSVAIDQHLAIARMRSLEFARPTLRATNTGATVIIDHHGMVTHALPRNARRVLQGSVQGRGHNAETGWDITPYAAWVSRWGLWPLWALMLAVLLAAALARLRGAPPRE